MRIFHVPDFYAALNNWAVWHGRRNLHTLYLTFDDGPHPEVTPFTLEMLKKHNARGAFFCSGRQAEKYPELLQLIKGDGHAIGNHGYAHFNGKKVSDKTYFADIEKAQALLQSPLFRPPYGKLTRIQRCKLAKKYRIVMWDVMPYDFDDNLPKEKAWHKTQKYVKPGSIIVLHDSPQAGDKMLYLLEKILVYYKVAGMGFEPLNL